MSLRIALLVLPILGLSACGTVPTVNDGSRSAATSTLPAGFEVFLDDAAAGSSVELTDSPWGTAVTVRAHAPYFAASGRTCRDLTIEAQGMRRPGLVCKQHKGSWQNVRVLHYGGRPLLTVNVGQAQERVTE